MDRYTILKNENLKNILKSVVNLICYDDVVDFKFEGSNSYTDGKTITVGVPDIAGIEKKNIEEITILEKGLTGHECQHKRSSNWDVLREGINEMEQYFIDKYNLYSGGYIFKEIFNAVEDGRIEAILSYNYLGFVSYLHYLNITYWEDTDFLYEKLDDFRAFTLTICYLAGLGIYPKNYVKRYKKTELNRNLQKIKKYIRKGVTAYSCKDCVEICKKIIFTVEPFLIQFLTEKPDDSKNNFNEFTSNTECDYNEEYKNSENESKKGKNNSDNSSTEQNKDTQQDNKNNSNSLSDDNSNDDNKNENNKSKTGSKDKSNSLDEDGNSSASANDNEDNNSSSSNSKNNSSSRDNNSSHESNQGSNSSNNNADNNNKKNPNHIGNDIEDYSTGDDESTDSRNEELAISEKRLAVKNVIKQVTKELEVKDDEKFNIVNNKLNIKDVCSKYSDGINYDELRIYQGTNKKPSVEILTKGRKLERELEYILKNKSIPNRKTYKGLINVTELWQVKLLEPKMFIKKGREEKTDYVCEILLDSSGSMDNYNKAQYAIKTISIIEEGLRKIIPLKMVAFSAYGSIRHMIIKDFNDTKNINYAENSKFSFNHGNKDGFSIRLATKDLMLRPESKKILIVMSDGLPSDYSSDKIAKRDVMEAVSSAKRKGIVVIPIFFGSESEKTRLYPEYKEMYKENIISCEPKDIEKYLLLMLKRVISKH